MNYFITQRNCILDYDGSGFHDLFEVLMEFNSLEDAKKEFQKRLNTIEEENESCIIDRRSEEDSNSELSSNNTVITLISEYRKIKYSAWETDFIALEIIKTNKRKEKLICYDGVKDFGGCVA